MANREVADYRRRIIESAAALFSKSGYHGASTRDIAQRAQLNEATLFRHFPRKHDLYLAVLESELQNVHLRGDLLMELATAPDGDSALARTFALITAMLAEKRDLIRLLQFSALELGEQFDLLLRKYLGELVEVISGYLQPWIDKGGLQCTNAKAIVMTMIAIVLNYDSLFSVFTGDQSASLNTIGLHGDICAAIATRKIDRQV
jgi:AcrR family transcriptional regulator